MKLFAFPAPWRRLVRFVAIRELLPLRSVDLLRVLPLFGWPLRPPAIPPGHWVLLYDLELERQQLVQLVWPAQAAPGRGRISLLSPLGLVLLQASCGEQVQLKLLGQSLRYEVRDLLSQSRQRSRRDRF